MLTISYEEISEIIDLVNKLPDEYKSKSFELLLNDVLLLKRLQTRNVNSQEIEKKEELKVIDTHSFVIPIDVKAFLSQYGLEESDLWKLFIEDHGEIRPIYQLTSTRKATTEIQHALLMSLQQALTNGSFQVDIESLRERCREQKCYDGDNFSKNLSNNSKYFKGITNDQPLILSPDGKSELADLIEEIKG